MMNIYKKIFLKLFYILLFNIAFSVAAPNSIYAAKINSFKNSIKYLSSLEDRSFGSKGETQAAKFIKKEFKKISPETGIQVFSAPIMETKPASLTFNKTKLTVFPAKLNAITPPATPIEGLSGNLIYAKSGKLDDLKKLPIKNSIVFMDINSGKNWLNVASLGASALIYISDGETKRGFFDEKFELSPLDFPRFYINKKDLPNAVSQKIAAKKNLIAKKATLKSKANWKKRNFQNIYSLIEGSDPNLSEEVIILQAFYDSSSFISGKAPGADESLSIASLIEIGKDIAKNPLKRSVLLLATTGHAQSLTGVRAFYKAASGRSKELKKETVRLRNKYRTTKKLLHVFSSNSPFEAITNQKEFLIKNFNSQLKNQIKDSVEILTKELNTLRLKKQSHSTIQAKIEKLQDKRLALRKLSWKTNFTKLSELDQKTLTPLIAVLKQKTKNYKNELESEITVIKSSRELRKLVRAKEITGTISLYLSSHGEGFGSFGRGFFYNLRPRVNTSRVYSLISDHLENEAPKIEQKLGFSGLYKNTLRPNSSRPWESWFLDKPQFGSEIPSMAGLFAFTFATVKDARSNWATPNDTYKNVDFKNGFNQLLTISELVRSVGDKDGALANKLPRKGYSVINGKARFIRQGELFADQPAPNSIFLGFQGNTRFYAMTDSNGDFTFNGAASKKLVQSKMIIEGYKFDQNGKIIWAIDKKQTGKSAYRLKMRRLAMETKLIMFACKQTTLFDLLTPRTFKYMTKIEVLDGQRDARPLHYWFSRIDTRSSIVTSIFLEPNIPLKLTLSDSVLDRKMILINADKNKSTGKGFYLKNWPIIPATDFKAALDMWTLLIPRIENLESHGIKNDRIKKMQQVGLNALTASQKSWDNKDYAEFMKQARTSWALASKVYLDVDQTQKDVLIGVLFYIALFIPFAYCMERVLFSYANIHKRITAFLAILAVVIALIYNVHPAFDLTYSPIVVILAFFILGLSIMVSLIIFFRFEKEMILIQQRAHKTSTSEISKWKAFTSAFVIGVNNLRRRKIRTFLTCLTLVILTFTIMSFTAVKSVQEQTYTLYSDKIPYFGVLMKNIGWKSLPSEAYDIIQNDFKNIGITAPRGWLELDQKTNPALSPVSFKNNSETLTGLIGLSANEPKVTGIEKILDHGEWFDENSINEIILSNESANQIGANIGDTIELWGTQVKLVGIFNSKKFIQNVDLDGEPLTPVIFPSAAAQELSEVEAEAIESGEDIDTFKGRYTHISASTTAIIPYKTLLAIGGTLKAVAIAPIKGTFSNDQITNMVNRYGLLIFKADTSGTYICQSADKMNYSGISNILIPLIISALIVLNTMITSVYERKKEIAVYTSIGMAPTHVSYLFIAEAIAFAVISVVIGYLIAQSGSQILAGTPLWAGMTANYSSMAGVAAMLLVIAVTLISVIYPSRVAANIAIPDVNRSWKMPEVETNHIETTLPFLLKYEEQKDVGGFILEFLEAHTDVSHGVFSTSEIEVNFKNQLIGYSPEPHKQKEITCFKFDVRVWLAPFDFGVKQLVSLEFQPSNNHPNYLEAVIKIDRETGESKIWHRLNKNFINAIRKQFLVWRSLDTKNQQFFRNKIPEMIAFGYTGLKTDKKIKEL